jgi:PKD repeat protein
VDGGGNVNGTWDNHTTSTSPPWIPQPVPPGSAAPGDSDSDGVCEDLNGNGRPDFADVVLYFNQMSWIAANEPISAFDCNENDRIDFADVVWLFNHL